MKSTAEETVGNGRVSGSAGRRSRTPCGNLRRGVSTSMEPPDQVFRWNGPSVPPAQRLLFRRQDGPAPGKLWGLSRTLADGGCRRRPTRRNNPGSRTGNRLSKTDLLSHFDTYLLFPLICPARDFPCGANSVFELAALGCPAEKALSKTAPGTPFGAPGAVLSSGGHTFSAFLGKSL